MLEELGLGEATVAGGRRRRRLQHVHDPREARHAARRAPRAGAALKDAGPGARDRRRRLLRRGAAGADLRALSVRRRRLRPGLDPAPRRLARRGRRGRRARPVRIADERAFAAELPLHRERRSRPGCRSRWAATRCAPTASSRPSAAARSAAGRARSSPRSTRLAAEGVREVTLLGQNVNSYGRDLARRTPHVRRAAARVRRRGRDRAHPLHEPAPEGLPRARDRARWPSAPRSASTRTCRSSPARRGSSRRCGGRTRASATSRSSPRMRAAIPDLALDDGPHRRLPRRDGGRLPRDARGGRGGRLRRRVHVRLLARATAPRPPPCPTRSPRT